MEWNLTITTIIIAIGILKEGKYFLLDILLTKLYFTIRNKKNIIIS